MTPALPAWYAQKPVATVADLGTGAKWVPFVFTPDDVAAFRRATGAEPGGATPQGVIPLIGRFAYLGVHRAPPGGVLARLTWRNVSAMPTDGRALVRSEVVDDFEKRGRRRIVIDTDIVHVDRRPIATVSWELVWPEGAE